MSQEDFQTMYHYQGWFAKNPQGTSPLCFENRPIDLYKLHCEVINAGGVTQFIVGGLSPIIGARLGFVNIPGTDTGPARAGPVLADRLQTTDKDFLFIFDRQPNKTTARRHQEQGTLQKQNMENALAGQAVSGGAAPWSGEIPDPKLMNELID
ncbi:hypothetical protein BC628DRAFT_1414459 [Trametes gibbosa]|nr:hypothetical protein BC628DRAFT_1414459 [Trametes gibbosa]